MRSMYDEYTVCLLIYLVPYLNSMKRIIYAYWETLNATPGTKRFKEICEVLHWNNVMFVDTDILPDNTYTHVYNRNQTFSWLNHIAMSKVQFQYIIDCCTLPDVTWSDQCAITVAQNFDQLSKPHNVAWQMGQASSLEIWRLCINMSILLEVGQYVRYKLYNTWGTDAGQQWHRCKYV